MKDKNEIPSAAEFGLIRAYLAQAGVSQAEITAVIGANVSGRTRAEIAADLRTWIGQLTK